MTDFEGQGEKSCAYVGEGVTFKGSIAAPEKIVVHGTVEGDVVARDLLVGSNGTIKGNVKVDLADIQGRVLENVEAKVCLSLRKSGRIEGTASYGEIEIEKGGVLSGEVHALNGAGKSHDAVNVVSPPISFGSVRSVAEKKEAVSHPR
ncbi:MAG TPA: polymer-forming cytoskeletal protein [Pseudorhodoplanes sp.]|jgi:cytoskeletal protein CcmA (bactofilin family)|nr:polymer-forming cytoskeletal protein [Pseudorhodoplanes sp.]